MGEQIGTKNIGSTTFNKLFRGTLGPEDIVPVVVAGGSAVTYALGTAMRNSATAGKKEKYTNAIAVDDEAVGSADGAETAFDLDHSNVIPASLKAFSAGSQKNASLSAGTGAGGKDQIVFDVAPTSGEAITADYDYYDNAKGAEGACILMSAEATTVAGGNVTADGARDGSVDATMVKDGAGVLVDAYFKAALPKVSFD